MEGWKRPRPTARRCRMTAEVVGTRFKGGQQFDIYENGCDSSNVRKAEFWEHNYRPMPSDWEPKDTPKWVDLATNEPSGNVRKHFPKSYRAPHPVTENGGAISEETKRRLAWNNLERERIEDLWLEKLGYPKEIDRDKLE